MKLIDMSNKLKDLEVPVLETYLVHYIMLHSLLFLTTLRLIIMGMTRSGAWLSS
jgi:hypothetical protein